MRCGIYPESKRGHLTELRFGHEVLFHFIYLFVLTEPRFGHEVLFHFIYLFILTKPRFGHEVLFHLFIVAPLWRGPTGLTLESALLG